VLEKILLFPGELNYVQMKTDGTEKKGTIYAAYLARGKKQEEQGNSHSVIHQCRGIFESINLMNAESGDLLLFSETDNMK
jgi:hypothetical protein